MRNITERHQFTIDHDYFQYIFSSPFQSTIPILYVLIMLDGLMKPDRVFSKSRARFDGNYPGKNMS